MSTSSLAEGAAVAGTVRGRRRIAVAGAVYVAGWVAGLALGPAGPSPTAADAAIERFYAQHGGAILLQSGLVHGVAAAALAALALTIPRVTAPSAGVGRAVTRLGLAAAVVSLAQVGIAVVAVLTAGGRDAPEAADLFRLLNLADTAKLVLLAGFALAVLRSGSSLLPRWFAVATVLLAVLLPLGGASFVVTGAALTAALYASLPLLLVWVGSVAVLLGRRG